MYRQFSSMIIILVAALGLCSCSVLEPKETPSSVAELLAYKDAYVGDNSAVGNIIYNLDGSPFVEQFALQTEKEPYGIEIIYGLDEGDEKAEYDKVWSEENYQGAFLRNTTAIFALVKNADYITVVLNSEEQKRITVTRDALEKYYGEDLRTFAESEQIWTEKFTADTMQNHEAIGTFFDQNVSVN